MANFRLINTAIWDDEWFTGLDAIEQHLFMYFLTNASTNIAGIYQISLRKVAFESGMDQEKVKKIIKRFSDDGRLFYEQGYVILKNWLKHQHLNTSQWVAVANTINALPDWLKLQLHETGNTLSTSYNRLSQGFITLSDDGMSLTHKERKDKSFLSGKKGNKADGSNPLEGSPAAKKKTPLTQDDIDIAEARKAGEKHG